MTSPTEERISSGIEGFDTVLQGGFIPKRAYMVTGRPGTGKTILGLHYLTSGTSDETSLFVNLEESEEDIRANAAKLGFDLTDVSFLDLSPESDVFTNSQQYDIFGPDEVEGPKVTATIEERVREHSPDRVFIDPLTQLRNLAPDNYQFRKQINGLTRFFKQYDATVLFTSQATKQAPDEDLQYVSDGTIELKHSNVSRTLSVPKFRGSATESGPHSVRITDEGLKVYPVLKPDAHRREFSFETISSGVPEIDHLLHGGIERGTVTILSGPTGVGKTTLGTQFMKEAAGRGERSVIYMFEENRETLFGRSKAVNIPAKEMVDRGTLSVEEVEPLDKSPAEFASMVRTEVEEHDAEIVMIDGIDGYRLSLQGPEDDLERELNSLGRYLKNMGVAVILVESTNAVTGQFKPTNSGLSYLADNIVFLRYLEMQGELQKAIGILKKRTSNFERSLRQFEITQHGITVGESLTGIRGILSGTPEFAERENRDGG